LRAFEEVYADCDAALASVDDCREAGLIRGKALVAQGKTEAAEMHLESLLAYYPNDEVLRYWHSKAAFEVPKFTCVTSATVQILDTSGAFETKRPDYCTSVCVCVVKIICVLALLVQQYKY
jgi:hypothetical protein